jgi:hypothetical protein
MEKRNDIHRRGVFQPEFYRFVGWYTLRSMRGGRGAKGANVLRASVEAWEGSEEAQDFKAMQYGTWGQCAVCGAHYALGEIWQHDESKDMIHIGWECAFKYKLVSGTDWTAIKDERDRYLKGEKTRAKAATFLTDRPELAAALETDHPISRDLKYSVGKYGSLSEKQIALALRIRDQAAANKVRQVAIQAQRDAEVKVAAPTGRVTIRGVVMSLKNHESMYGVTLKMTVKVATADGVWLAWGSVPTNLVETLHKGDEVEFMGTVEAGREPHFAFFKRPTKASVVKAAEVQAVAS